MLAEILKALGALGIDRGQALSALVAGDEVLPLVRRLLGIAEGSEDEVLGFVIQTIEDMVLSYLNQEELPAPLRRVIAVMAVSYYRSAGLGQVELPAGPVTSVKRGDVTTSFAAKEGASGVFNLGTDRDDFFGWQTVLDEYRKLRW